MSGIAALVLAGGRGERLGGVRKAALKIGGRRLIDRAAANLAPHCAPLIVSTGRIEPVLLGLPAGATPLPDLDLPIGGPLAGILALADRLRSRDEPIDLVVSLAVDTPLVPKDFVPRLLAGLGGAAAAYATCGENFYPTNAIWRRSALEQLADRVRRGAAPRSIRVFLQEIGAVTADWPDGDGDPFANVNTLADLLSLERRAGASR